MFGFGDAERPCTATVELIDGILTDYMRTLVRMRTLMHFACAAIQPPRPGCRQRRCRRRPWRAARRR